MGLEPLGLAERDRRSRERAQRLRSAFEDRGAFHEIEHAEAGGESRRSRGRQHVIGAGDVIADRFRRMRADKNRAGIADAAGKLFGIAGDDFQMFGGDGVGERRRFAEIANEDDRAEVAPRRAGDCRARQCRKLTGNRTVGEGIALLTLTRA